MNSSISPYEQQHLTFPPKAGDEIYQYVKKFYFWKMSTKL
jgi:hypothetical protein